MGIKKTIGRLAGTDVPGNIKETFSNKNASTMDKAGVLLDPHNRLIPKAPRSPERIAARAEKKKKKQLAASRAMGAKYAKGGKVKTYCRGMGAATRGGRFRKDG